MDNVYVLILLCGGVTYLTRSGGYLIMAMFGTVHHRVQAALDVVPIAVLSALVSPWMVSGSVVDAVVIALVCLLSLRLPLLPSVILGTIAVAFMRQLLG
ncbi:AzlD domain-containing protein [Cognatishimia sp. SS12]|uniref:AzlD family protein n=1 Tax=Cognatishimia sp. SS12 TaxID=2979465 RepID=UPI00232D1767|nr:AzlD domain-containing protein [Cognatishimia sp. SS12]MDC0739645.1 AzlD domain-containing protein [Cognatishimia sp. SS12]